MINFELFCKKYNSGFMKGISLSLLIFFSGSMLVAQPNYSLKNYQVQTGKSSRFYARESKAQIKRSQYARATLNAAMALKKAEKKSQISNAQERLNSSYEQALENDLNRIEILKKATSSFDGDQTVTNFAEMIRIYKTIGDIQQVLAGIPRKSFNAAKRKDTGFSYEPVDFSNDLESTKVKFEESKKEAAAMHYAQGRALENSEGKEDLKNSAKHFRWANQYSPNYRDATERYNEIKVVATTRMGVNKFDMSVSSKYGDVAARLTDELLNSISAKAKTLEFFEVIDRDQLDRVIKEQKLSLSGLMDETTTAEIGELKGVDVILVGNITESIVDRQKSGPTEKSYTKNVVLRKEKYKDEDGKEKTREIKGDVKATAKIITKTAEATVGCTYKVVDVQTGEVIESGSTIGTDTWTFRWIDSFTGDKRALPIMSREEKKYPGYSKMTNSASKEASSKVFSGLNTYISAVGN